VEVFVARQAIFDRNLGLFAYELLFRSCQRNSAAATDDTASTLQVFANSLFSSGLEALACNAPVFINFGQELLTSKFTSLFPPKSVVIEILETVKPLPDVIASCQTLKKMGYLLALDDVVGERRNDQLVEVANFIKVDFRGTTREEQLRIAQSFHSRGKRLVAEKVETHEEFAWACEAGYDYFQGFFFAKPTLLRGQNVPSAKVNSLRLLRELQYPELEFERLETVIRCDISLTYKLFRYVNSALFARSKAISNIKDALVVMGELDIRRWITLATLPALGAGGARELMVHALVRAKFCEMLADAAGIDPASDAFLVGMFSLLDALVDRPLSEILVELNLPAAICAPLLGTSGPTAVSVIYEIALRYETGEWTALDSLMKQVSLQGQAVADLYLKAIAWSDEMFGLVSAEPPSSAGPARSEGSAKRTEFEGTAASGLLAMHNALEQTRTVQSGYPHVQNGRRSFK
jgi:c-di-GMP-related signal transduction protein